MSRKREIPPELFLDPAFNSIPTGARLFYIGLLFHLDYHGVILNDAAYLHKTVFQCDAKMQRSMVTKYLASLCQIGRLVPFTHNQLSLLYAPYFHRECRVYPDEIITYDVPLRSIPGYNPEFNRGKLRVRSASSSTSSFTSTSTPTPDGLEAGIDVPSVGNGEGTPEEEVERRYRELCAKEEARKRNQTSGRSFGQVMGALLGTKEGTGI